MAFSDKGLPLGSKVTKDKNDYHAENGFSQGTDGTLTLGSLRSIQGRRRGISLLVRQSFIQTGNPGLPTYLGFLNALHYSLAPHYGH